MFTSKKRWILTGVAGTLAITGLVMAESGTDGTRTPSDAQPQRHATASGEQTTMSGRLVNLRQFMMGQTMANGSASGSADTLDASGHDASRAAAADSTALSSNAGSDANAGRPHDGKSMKGNIDDTLALVDGSGNLVILGQSWHEAKSGAASIDNANTPANGTNGTAQPGTIIGSTDTGSKPNSASPTGTPSIHRAVARLSQCREYVNQQINVTGRVYTRAGMKYLDVHSVDCAMAAAHPQSDQPHADAR